ncbi:MAG: hypothetical protein ACI8XB_000868 [Patiriisocius sp.]|jgi:hypothetical protein
MKKTVLFLAFALIASFTVSAQGKEVATENGPQISLDKDVHDYGEIEKGGEPYCEFLITNDGNEPLIISNAKGSCGCTVPEWSKEPILPGESSIMKVKYDTKRVGPINKSVTVNTNAVNSPTKVLRIKGKVLGAATAPSAPVKATPAGAPVNN